MKKSNNKVTRYAIILLALTMVALILVSGTYAKYTSSVSATSNARVAKWLIKVNNQDISSSTPQTLTIDLWGTVKDTKDGNAEGDIATKANETDATIIAPGTKGEFTLQIKNESEVNAEYKVELTSNIGDIPLEFSTDGTTWKKSVADLNVDTTALNMGATSSELKIQWRWAFTGATSSNYTSSQTDATDTDLGVAGSATATVTATVTVDQVD